MEIINLTPHPIIIVGGNGKALITFPSEGEVRISQKTVRGGSLLHQKAVIPLTQTQFGEVQGLPAPKEGTNYIVSSLVCQACPDRQDLLIPNESVRDEQGRIVGCKSLSRNPFKGVAND